MLKIRYLFYLVVQLIMLLSLLIQKNYWQELLLHLELKTPSLNRTLEFEDITLDTFTYEVFIEDKKSKTDENGICYFEIVNTKSEASYCKVISFEKN